MRVLWPSTVLEYRNYLSCPILNPLNIRKKSKNAENRTIHFERGDTAKVAGKNSRNCKQKSGKSLWRLTRINNLENVVRMRAAAPACTAHSTRSPTCSCWGGFMNMPTPGGVPVRITSPKKWNWIWWVCTWYIEVWRIVISRLWWVCW